MVSARYTPRGCQSSYSKVYGKQTVEGENWIADPYHYMIYVLEYECETVGADKSKFHVEGETPTIVGIFANSIGWLNSLYACNIPEDDFRGYLKLPQRPQKKDGVYFLGEEIVGDSQLEDKVMQYHWLITYNDTLPFEYVSRKEYLQIQKKRLLKTQKDDSGSKDYYEPYMKKINDQLNGTESYLSMPAICNWNDEEMFDGFAEEGTKGSFIAVKPNLQYYHKKLPMSAPQFFYVSFTVKQGDPIYVENISEIQKAIDFSKLKNMLGK
jgi:hypothetical protein